MVAWFWLWSADWLDVDSAHGLVQPWHATTTHTHVFLSAQLYDRGDVHADAQRYGDDDDMEPPSDEVRYQALCDCPGL